LPDHPAREIRGSNSVAVGGELGGAEGLVARLAAASGDGTGRADRRGGSGDTRRATRVVTPVVRA
jgi:hypothetical protein